MNSSNYIDVGYGEPAIVFIHGICCKPTDYQWHIDAFAQSRRVIAPLLRGHSEDDSLASEMSIEQMATDVVKLLRDQNIKNAVVCGHSLGTRIAVEVHAQCPDVVKGLVLIDGSNTVSNNLEAVLKRFDTLTNGNKIESWLQEQFEQMFLPRTFVTERTMYHKRIAKLSNPHLATLYRNMIFWDANKFAVQLQHAACKPLLVLQSTMRAEDGSRRSLKAGESALFPKFVENSHPGAHTIAYSNLSHFIHLDEPELLFNDITTWMKANNLC